MFSTRREKNVNNCMHMCIIMCKNGTFMWKTTKKDIKIGYLKEKRGIKCE